MKSRLIKVKLGENKENKIIKPSNIIKTKSEYAQYFSDKQMPKVVSINLTDDNMVEKKPVKHAKNRSMSDFVVESNKKK